MTPEEIKQLLADSKQLGLSGGTLRQLQQATSSPEKMAISSSKLKRKAHQSELAKQATMGLQAALGPAGIALPSLGLLAEGVPTAIQLGSELGDVAQKGFVSNQNFDNTMMAMLGFGAMPLFSRTKGQGQLYSRLINDLDEAGDLPMNATSLGKILKKGNYSKDELKTLDVMEDMKWFDPREPITAKQYSEKLYDTRLRKQLTGKIEADEASQDFIDVDPRYIELANIPTHEPYPGDKYKGVTFPQMMENLRLSGRTIDKHNNEYKNVLMQVRRPKDVYGYPLYATDDHWNGQGDIHARIAYNRTVDGNPIGMLAEVQSDLWKKDNPIANSPFVENYENVATRQGLLELLQKHNDTGTSKPLDLVFPTGKLQQEVNASDSPAYLNIYDRRVPKAISKSLGDDAVIQQLQGAPFTRLKEGYANDWNNILAPEQDKLNYALSKGFVEVPYDWHREGELPRYVRPELLEEYKRLRPVNPAENLIKGTDARNLSDQAYDDYYTIYDGIEQINETYRNTPKEIPPIELYPDVELSSKFEDKLQDDLQLTINSLFGFEPGKYRQLTKTQDLIQNNIYRILRDKAQKDYAASPEVSAPKLYSTTIPSEKVQRLAKEGIPLWMLPVGLGMSSQLGYNNERSQPQ